MNAGKFAEALSSKVDDRIAKLVLEWIQKQPVSPPYPPIPANFIASREPIYWLPLIGHGVSSGVVGLVDHCAFSVKNG
jgi:hypothetical protein